MADGTEWVEIIEPSRREHMFANLKTGQCLWDPPVGVQVKPTHENQWWELYDTNTKRYYYYNATSQKTVWQKPKGGDIIPLSKLQMLKAKEEIKQKRLSTEYTTVQEEKNATNNNYKPKHNRSHSEPEIISLEDIPTDDFQGDLNHLGNDVRTDAAHNRKKDNNFQNHVYQNHQLKKTKKISEGGEQQQEENSGTQLVNNTEPPVDNKNRNTGNGILAEKQTNFQTLDSTVESTASTIGKGDSLSELRRVSGDSSTVESPPLSPMEAIPARDNFAHPDNKSATLPARSGSKAVNVPKFHSFKGKGAPKKPPRTTVTVEKSTPPSERSTTSAEKSSTLTVNPSASVEKNKENVGPSYEISVQKTPEAKRKHFIATQDKERTSTASPPVETKPAPMESYLPPVETESSVSEIVFSEENFSCEDEPEYENLPFSQRSNNISSIPVQTESATTEAPSSNIPVAPPPPPAPQAPSTPYSGGHQRFVSRGGSAHTRSVYDNISDDSYDENCLDTSTSSNLDETFATSDESYTPSGTLLRNGETTTANRASYYERLRDNENVEPEISAPCPRTSGPEVAEIEKVAAIKRSPLTRMKSDISDTEKRPKFAKNQENLVNSGFRPMSMLNLASSGKPLKKTCSDSAMPSEVKTSLNTHRKGIFRRRMSIHSMLSWSKTPIKKPMVMTRDKQQRKDALEVFKLILQCMGDKSTRKSFDSLAVEITTRGWQTSTLRDEIYVQLCKQTTSNEKLKSLKAGWELMTACLSIFPPSNKFHSYLEGYIYKYLDPDDLTTIATEAQVDKYAKFCYKQLERICQTGAKRGLKGPTVDEIQAAIKRVFNPSMFGNTLEDIMEMQADRMPDHRLPWILTTLTDAILLLNGLQTEGIFRVPGDIDGVNALKLQADRWEGNNQLQDPHIPASLLKLWFRDLYDPLIPQCFYDQCINNCNNVEVCLNIVNSLPPLNNLVFSYLIRLLQAFMIPDNVSQSKMGEDNLAMVWAPNCLRCPSEDPREIFDNTRKEMTFLRTVMRNLDTTFLEGVM